MTNECIHKFPMLMAPCSWPKERHEDEATKQQARIQYQASSTRHPETRPCRFGLAIIVRRSQNVSCTKNRGLIKKNHRKIMKALFGHSWAFCMENMFKL